MFMRIVKAMLKENGRLSKKQRGFLAKHKGKFSPQQVSIIREIHNNKNRLIRLSNQSSVDAFPHGRASPALELDKLQHALYAKAIKVSGYKMNLINRVEAMP